MRGIGVILALPLVTVVLAGCMADAPPVTTVSPTNVNSKVEFRAAGALGEVLTDAGGRTLYIFTNDNKSKSNCYGQCATSWPPFIASSVPAALTEIAGKLSLVTRTDGMKQVAYREMPLYYYVSDTAAGETKGDGLNAIWFVVRKPPSGSLLVEAKGSVAVTGENVTYQTGTTGFYARPNGTAATSGVVMIHEWWGLNDNIRDYAKLLASHGYAVLAVDLFKGKVATTSAEAQAQVASLNQDEATANMRAAAAYLRDHGATKVSGLGWCFGGGQSLQLALSGETLAATVIYYGFLVTDQSRLTPIKWPVLGVFGEVDQAIGVPTVRAFEKALNNLTVDNDVYIYPEVGHAFANPSGDGWAPDETKDAWTRTLDFLKKNAAP